MPFLILVGVGLFIGGIVILYKMHWENPKLRDKVIVIIVVVFGIVMLFIIIPKFREMDDYDRYGTTIKANYKIKVESDTYWRGSFDGRTVEGKGNDIIDIGDEYEVCCSASKELSSGYLRLTVIDANNSSFFGESKETTASYGSVTVCLRN